MQKGDYKNSGEKRLLREKLENRLIDFSVEVLQLSEVLPSTRIGTHICGQLIRCSTSPAFNYGEAQSAESNADFVHKMKICLKELRETMVCLKIIARKQLVKNPNNVNSLVLENNELISIFVTSINTAGGNQNK